MRFGYDYNKLKFEDNVCIINDKLVGVIVDTSTDKPQDKKYFEEGYFEYQDGVYKLAKSIPTLKTVAELRKDLYLNGFYCDGTKYIQFKRSTGSSRVGKCLFIEETLHKRIMHWSKCGLKIEEGQEIDLAAFESGSSLTLSSIIDTIQIKPENILIIDDFDSCFKDKAVSVYIENNSLKAKTGLIDIKNSIWDGQSLMDESLFGKYSNYGMLLLRNRFFKSCCFNTNIQTFFKDNNITEISQLNGFTIAKNINDIKLITTPNSIKYVKFSNLKQWINTLDSMFGIVKHEKPTHFFDGDMVQIHYQLLNTLQLEKEEVEKIVQPNLDYIKLIDDNPSFLKYHIQYPDDIMLNLTALVSKNDIIYNMIGLNERFVDTKLYCDFKRDLVRSMIKSLKKGHLLVNGNYSTLFGNPYEMLLSSIGKFEGKSEIGKGYIHSINFRDGEEIIGSRSPHVTMGNVWLTKNKINDNISRYFNLTKEIVCINSIEENLLERLSGADMDSDTCLLSNNKILINAARKNYHKFGTPTSLVQAKKVKRFYTQEEKCDLDIKTSVNKIGEIINFSQELNSLFWDCVHNLNSKQRKIYDGDNWREVYIKEINTTLGSLYEDIAILDVMSCIEIDKAKKEFAINNAVELKKLKSKYKLVADNKTVKPYFFGVLAKMKGYYSPNTKMYKQYHTSMDFLQEKINTFKMNKSPDTFLSFSEILKSQNYNSKYVKYNQINQIIEMVNKTKDEISAMWQLSKEEMTITEKFLKASEIRQDCINYIDSMNMSEHTIYRLLLKIESEKCKKIRRLLFSILFGAPNKDFYQLIESHKTPIQIAQKNDDGDIKVFDFKFKI